MISTVIDITSSDNIRYRKNLKVGTSDFVIPATCLYTDDSINVNKMEMVVMDIFVMDKRPENSAFRSSVMVINYPLPFKLADFNKKS